MDLATRQCPDGFAPVTRTICPGKSENEGTSLSSSRTRMPAELAISPSSCTDASFSLPSLSQTTLPTTVTSSCDAAYTARDASAPVTRSVSRRKSPILDSSMSTLSPMRSRMNRTSVASAGRLVTASMTRTATGGRRVSGACASVGRSAPSSVLTDRDPARLA